MSVSDVQDDLHDHLELQQYIVDMDVRVETLKFDTEMELTAHLKLDEFLRRGMEHEDMKTTVLEEKGVKMNISM